MSCVLFTSCLQLGTREPILAERSPLFSRAKTDVHTYSKKLTPSDVNTHGGLSIPKQLADECFPPLVRYLVAVLVYPFSCLNYAHAIGGNWGWVILERVKSIYGS